jgi:acetyl-CoA C-acetyltransferase
MRRIHQIVTHLDQGRTAKSQQQSNLTANESTILADNDVCIISVARTPFGSFMGNLSSLSAIQLGAEAVKGAIARSGLKASDIEEVFLGCVVQANLGQNPARQVSLLSGIPVTTPCTTINKVCVSGLKATAIAATSIASGQLDVAVAGGMESMSNAPFYVPSGRKGNRYGNTTFVDGLVRDGLSDAYSGHAMGVFGEQCVAEFKFSRADQDAYALSSYARAKQHAALISEQIVPVSLAGKNGKVTKITADQETANAPSASETASFAPSFVSKQEAAAGKGSITKVNK